MVRGCPLLPRGGAQAHHNVGLLVVPEDKLRPDQVEHAHGDHDQADLPSVNVALFKTMQPHCAAAAGATQRWAGCGLVVLSVRHDTASKSRRRRRATTAPLVPLAIHSMPSGQCFIASAWIEMPVVSTITPTSMTPRLSRYLRHRPPCTR